MAASEFDDLCFGKPRDVVIFVDDWKGGSAKPEDPVFYLGRGFALYRPDELRLMRVLLLQANAKDWHATDRKSLFMSQHYAQIFQALDEGSSFTFDTLADRKDLMAPHLDEEAAKVAHLAAYWPRTSPYARGLLRFLCAMHQHLAFEFHDQARTLGAVERLINVLVVTDRLDWINDRSAPIVQMRMPTPAPEVAKLVDFEVVTITDKDAAAAHPFLPFLGLVDSEAWHFARTQMARLADGKTVRQRFQQWRDRGGSKDDPVLVDVDEPAIRAALHNENGWHFFESGFLIWMKNNRRMFLWDP